MSKMSSRERVFRAIDGGVPDRVPVAEMVIDSTVIDSIQPGMTYEDFIDYADIDIVSCLTMADPIESIDWVDKERHIWRDKWGALQVRTHDVISTIMGPPRIECEACLDNYEPPDPNKAAVHDYAKRLVDRFKGSRAIAVVGECSFAPSQYLRAGLENLMLDYALEPGLVKKLARVGVDYHVELYRKLIANGVEIVWLGDDYAGKTGTFMSPTHFGEYILPAIKTVVTEIKAAGAYCFHHTDGDIWNILDMLISAGIDMLGPLEPAYMPLDKVRRYGSGRVGTVGNIDVDLLSRGSVEDVKLATRDLIGRMNGLGGHILSSGNTISSSVKGENYMAMLDAGRDYSARVSVY